MTDEDARMDQVWFDGLTVDTIMKVCHFQNYWSILHLQYCYQVIFQLKEAADMDQADIKAMDWSNGSHFERQARLYGKYLRMKSSVQISEFR